MLQRSETRLAVLEQIGDDRIEIRLKPGAFVDLQGLREVIAERRRLTEDKPVGVLVVIPGDTDLDALVVSTNHYDDPENSKGLRAVAVVVQTVLMETMARLFLAYYPPAFSMSLFKNEADAQAWLALELAETTDQA